MAFKFVVFAAMVAAANAGLIAQPGLAYSSPLGYASHGYAAPLAYAAPVAKIAAPLAYSAPLSYAAPVAQYAAPVAYAKVASIDADYDPNPQYSYAYDIQDGLTGDSKSQHESRSGDVVQGSYSLIDADGLKRTVDYTADPHNGFNAVVRREPIGHAVKVIAPVAKVVSPLGYASPLSYAAPVAKFASPLGYASPLSYAAPVAKIAAPLAYSAPAYYH